jgi:hypothetical protein
MEVFYEKGIVSIGWAFLNRKRSIHELFPGRRVGVEFELRGSGYYHFGLG